MADYNEIEQRILDMWPKFEDGCYVQLGDKVVANSGENKGREFIVRNVYFENGHGKLRSSVSDGCYWTWKAADPYVKRPAPKVLDADGVEIKVGDIVYDIRTGAKINVEGIEGDGVLKTDDEYGLKWRIINSHDVTHKPPVRDIDGVLIKAGDTVYDAKGEGHIVKEVYFDDDESPEHTVWCGEFKSGIAVVYIADQLTHTRPDSWQRLEEDATMPPWSYCDKHGLLVDRSDDESDPAIETFAIDLIRRAKALAEKEAGR